MELLDYWKRRGYDKSIAPGVYDIHSPRVPPVAEMVDMLRSAEQALPRERLWVAPDCGLKTRAWPETEAALRNMVDAARQLREQPAPVG
jgi:5-methyltetrahydropteroyltriglutamate--homocysteine methyltransferase